MGLDRPRLAEVLNADYSYYEGPEPVFGNDERVNLDAGDFTGRR